jgi:hypothetical protein
MGAMERGTLIVVNVAGKTEAGVNARETRKLQITRLGIIVRSARQNKWVKYCLVLGGFLVLRRVITIDYDKNL